jgi:hypothetical protein
LTHIVNNDILEIITSIFLLLKRNFCRRFSLRYSFQRQMEYNVSISVLSVWNTDFPKMSLENVLFSLIFFLVMNQLPANHMLGSLMVSQPNDMSISKHCIQNPGQFVASKITAGSFWCSNIRWINKQESRCSMSQLEYNFLDMINQDRRGRTVVRQFQIQRIYSLKCKYHTPAKLFLYKNTATRCHRYKADNYIIELRNKIIRAQHFF